MHSTTIFSKIFHQINKPQAELRMLTRVFFRDIAFHSIAIDIMAEVNEWKTKEDRIKKCSDRRGEIYRNSSALHLTVLCWGRAAMFEFNWKICAYILMFVSIHLTWWSHFYAQANGIPSYLDLYIFGSIALSLSLAVSSAHSHSLGFCVPLVPNSMKFFIFTGAYTYIYPGTSSYKDIQRYFPVFGTDFQKSIWYLPARLVSPVYHSNRMFPSIY